MDLIGGEEVQGGDAHLRRHAPAVLGHMRGIVVRSEPAIEAGIDAFGDAAVAREERVAQAGNG